MFTISQLTHIDSHYNTCLPSPQVTYNDSHYNTCLASLQFTNIKTHYNTCLLSLQLIFIGSQYNTCLPSPQVTHIYTHYNTYLPSIQLIFIGSHYNTCLPYLQLTAITFHYNTCLLSLSSHTLTFSFTLRSKFPPLFHLPPSKTITFCKVVTRILFPTWRHAHTLSNMVSFFLMSRQQTCEIIQCFRISSYAKKVRLFAFVLIMNSCCTTL